MFLSYTEQQMQLPPGPGSLSHLYLLHRRLKLTHGQGNQELAVPSKSVYLNLHNKNLIKLAQLLMDECVFIHFVFFPEFFFIKVHERGPH